MAKHPIRSNWAFLAQLVERSTFNRVAAGSNPAEGIWTTMIHLLVVLSGKLVPRRLIC